MAKIVGKNADFVIGVGDTVDPAEPTPDGTDALYDNNAALMQAMESVSNEVTLNFETRTDESTGYGDDYDTHELISTRWTVDINAYFATAATAALNTEQAFVNGLLDRFKHRFSFWPAGLPAGAPATQASATQPKYVGRVIIASASINPVRAGVALLRVRLVGDGKFYRTIVA